MKDNNSYVKQSVVLTLEQKQVLEDFSKVLREHKLDISFSGLVRMLIDCGRKDIKFAVSDKQFSLEEFSAARGVEGITNGM